jgi:ABC-2 type transport system ATP-binding protein
MSIISKNITKLYGKQKALDDVSFAIQPGEVVGLLGPNGAGKSTMMKIITCFIPPTSGEVTVDGYDVMDNSIEVRKIIGYLPEHNPLYMDMYVKEYLLYIAGIYKLGKIKKERISEIIDITGLGPEQNKKIGALSKGFCQRTGLAQALLHYPDVLILDEPTSGLDPNQLLEIRNLIKKIGKEKTILLSTHIMQEVEAICDRVIIIHEGRIVADDSTSNLSKISTNQDIITVEFSDSY